MKDKRLWFLLPVGVCLLLCAGEIGAQLPWPFAVCAPEEQMVYVGDNADFDGWDSYTEEQCRGVVELGC